MLFFFVLKVRILTTSSRIAFLLSHCGHVGSLFVDVWHVFHVNRDFPSNMKEMLVHSPFGIRVDSFGILPFFFLPFSRYC